MKNLLLFFLFFLAINSANAQIYRCGNSYSRAPCSHGKLVDQNNLSIVSNDLQSIRECQLKKDIYWTNTKCKKGHAEIGSYTAPNGLSFKEQVYIAKMKKQGRKSQLQKPTVNASKNSTTNKKKAWCQSIGKQIEALDDAMRRPQTASNMNYYSQQRRNLSDKRFRECR